MLQEELGGDLVFAKALCGITERIQALGFAASPPGMGT
jgi:hypothetical protein